MDVGPVVHVSLVVLTVRDPDPVLLGTIEFGDRVREDQFGAAAPAGARQVTQVFAYPHTNRGYGRRLHVHRLVESGGYGYDLAASVPFAQGRAGRYGEARELRRFRGLDCACVDATSVAATSTAMLTPGKAAAIPKIRPRLPIYSANCFIVDQLLFSRWYARPRWGGLLLFAPGLFPLGEPSPLPIARVPARFVPGRL